MSRQRGPIFQVERVPPELLRRAKARAAFECQSIRGVFLAFLQEYAAGSVTPKRDEDTSEPITPWPAGAPSETQPRGLGHQCVPSVSAPHPSPGTSSPDPDLGF